MAFRHQIQKRASGGRSNYEEPSNVSKEADEKKDGGRAKRRTGGRLVQFRAYGGAAKGRLDRRARGGGVGCDSSPFSSATKDKDHKITNDNAGSKLKGAQPRKSGGRTNSPFSAAFAKGGKAKALGGEVAQLRKDGGAVQRKHGGKAEHDDDGDED